MKLMAEYWFYHLESATLEGVLPELLEKTLSKGWRALVKLPESRLEELDEFLWTYRDDSFLPHGRDDKPQSDLQPINLSSNAQSSENRECVFLIDGEGMPIHKDTERCIILINGRDESDVQASRKKWKSLKNAGETISYWKQSERGQWEKKS